MVSSWELKASVSSAEILYSLDRLAVCVIVISALRTD